MRAPGRPPQRRVRAAAMLALALAVALALALAPGGQQTTGTALAVESPSADDSQDVVTAAGLPAPPSISSPAWVVYDATTQDVLAARTAETPRPIASLTKLMTALLVVEATKGDERVKVSERASKVGEGSALGMRPGERYPVDTLLQAALVYSANDAATALAEYVGGKERDFVKLMNERADELELTDTEFTSPTGLDSEPLTRATPRDVIRIAELALRDDRVRRAVAMREVRIERPGRDAAVLPNRNLLLGEYEGVDGVKTGHTEEAGWCLLTHWKDDRGGEVYVLVLGATDEASRLIDSRRLLDWSRQLRPTLTFAQAGDQVAQVPVRFGRGTVPVFIEDGLRRSVRFGQQVQERYVLPESLEGPVRAGDTVGRYELVVDGKVEATSPLYISSDVPRADLRSRLESYARLGDDAARAGWEEVADVARSLAA